MLLNCVVRVSDASWNAVKHLGNKEIINFKITKCIVSIFLIQSNL